MLFISIIGWIFFDTQKKCMEYLQVITFFFLYFDHENVAHSRETRLDIDLVNLLHTSDYFLYCLHTFPC